MMYEDLDMLGAEGLSGQYLILRIRSLDKQKLGQALGGGAAAAALPAALAAVDFAPQQVLSLLMPIVAEKVKTGYGVDLEYQVTDTPPSPGDKPKKHNGKMVLLGAVLGVAGAFAASRLGLVDTVVGTGQNLLHKAGL